MKWPDSVRIFEVGPRDGLQNEPVSLTTDQKVAWIDRLSASGLRHIEVSSFVSPHWIPALSDADEVFARIARVPGVSYAALVPNERGLERAARARPDVAAVFLSASETHNRRNINKSIAETLPVLQSVMRGARELGMAVRAYVSTSFGCPYEGDVDPEQVLRVAYRLVEDGADEVSLGDTIGVATPRKTEAVVSRAVREIPVSKIALHMHDTRGTALANILTGMQMGVTAFDSALGGLGGCPYAPGASGNVATDDLDFMLRGCGIETGIDPQALCLARKMLGQFLNRRLPSRADAVWRSQSDLGCDNPYGVTINE